MPDANTTSGPSPVLAAGAVLWRRPPSTGDGAPAEVELALIHRPKYDDWSFPKGKLRQGETAEQAALREVKEETGLDCLLGTPLPTRRYRVAGRPKEVRYWSATPTGGSFTSSAEVDRMEWLPAPAARERLTEEDDKPLVDALLRAIGEGQRPDNGG